MRQQRTEAQAHPQRMPAGPEERKTGASAPSVSCPSSRGSRAVRALAIGKQQYDEKWTRPKLTNLDQERIMFPDVTSQHNTVLVCLLM